MKDIGMAFQFSTAARNAGLDSIETAIGTAPTLEIRSGAAPANCGTADSGTLLASMALPSDWMAAASGGAKAKLGTWQDLSADAGGTAGHFRVKQGGTCHIQGSITASGGGGDMIIDNVSIAIGQQITVTAFNITAGGA
jgi:hypothetical protein